MEARFALCLGVLIWEGSVLGCRVLLWEGFVLAFGGPDRVVDYESDRPGLGLRCLSGDRFCYEIWSPNIGRAWS